MQEPASPSAESLWKLAMACTNDASGAARVVASMVRDYGELEKISEARLRRATLERAQRWLDIVAEERARPVSTLLVRTDAVEGALLWLDAGEALPPIELSWILGIDPETVRSNLQDLYTQFSGSKAEIAADLVRDFEQQPRDELMERLAEAREIAAKRSKRKTMVVLLLFVAFVVLMGIVFLSLMNWQGATLQGGRSPGALP